MKEKLQLLKRNQIDTSLWNTCVEESVQSIVFAFSWYLDITSPDWWAVIIQKNEKYVWVMPLPVKKKQGFHFIKMPLFTHELGYFSSLQNADDYTSTALQIIKNEIPYCIDYTFNSKNKVDTTIYVEDINVSLTKSWEDLYSLFSKNKKRNIRRGINRNNELIELKEIDTFLDIFEKNTAKRIGNIDIHFIKEQLKQLYQVLYKHNVISIFATATDNNYESVSIFIKHKNHFQYLLNTATEGSRSKNSRNYILSEFIKSNLNKATALHFGTYVNLSEIDIHYKNQLRPYFEGFTKDRILLPALKWNNLPWYINFIHLSKKFVFKQISKIGF
ncbi:hypothetical protein [Flammeovirga kamogawensis]|uniref:GNAT family N-acetyltransferase n=1 Tax=Flammeovirga kamogawensis TaxID=373891 RepID=A0ABX8H0L7_9BACT|nr:hypothetical protein [Flammeovirga kamogawensis]MBB6462314.1 hypothetical protein [Flammeovirga kamogawensis]QWG09433.1 hypothetical protein KM029_22765 [Flammeovirga kamogawensis]TRX64949.1 hypothetical protein EO216_20670 [Flammeovirga kamogawensis]